MRPFTIVIAFIAILLTLQCMDINASRLYQDYIWDKVNSWKLAAGTKAVDVAQQLSVDSWKCFLAAGYSVAIPRGYRSIGAVDATLAANVKNAQSAGYTIKNTHAYFFPNVKSTTKSLTQQFNEFWDYITQNQLKIEMVWLDVEDDDHKYWFTDKTSNQLKLDQLLAAVHAKKAVYGFYTNKNNWATIFGLNYNAPTNAILWYARYDNKAECSDFSPFSGFNKALLKQYAGDEATICGKIDHDSSVYC